MVISVPLICISPYTPYIYMGVHVSVYEIIIKCTPDAYHHIRCILLGAVFHTPYFSSFIFFFHLYLYK